ncbi:MAG: GntR family transcriptional regulator [Dysgonamonadaceae bacterium]|jgi:DNA-binding transcriptional regulator YhcF (GntR family)|nr:GntR family transcriptional regulator [Dysgonamonadaceae bacterium]
MQFNDSQAIYLQIAGFVEDKILRKEWSADERIPSVRDLAVSLEVNPNTAMRTYDYLQQQGIIYNQRGIGYFVSSNGFKLVLKTRKNLFMKENLPEFFKNITLLGFTMEEITGLYQHHLQQNKK